MSDDIPDDGIYSTAQITRFNFQNKIQHGKIKQAIPWKNELGQGQMILCFTRFASTEE
jgi:hypothetical protein